MSNPRRSSMSVTQQTPSRRRFLLHALGLGAAGLAVGGGAAWTKNQLAVGAEALTQTQTLQNQLTETATAKATLDVTVADLQTRFTALQIRMDGVLTQNAELATSLSAAQQTTTLLQAQLNTKQTELDSAHTRLSESGELINLYTLLDGVNLDAAVETGLAAVSGGLVGSLTLAPTVRAGLTQAATALADFETWLPDVETMVAWVGEQVVKITAGLMAIELAAQRFVTGLVTGFEAVFGGLIKFILEHLPFGLGDDVNRALTVTHALLVTLPDVTAGLKAQVLDKIAPRVTAGTHHWKNTLVTPVRDQALAPTTELLTRLDEANTAFVNALQTPAQTALTRRAELRQQIVAYRGAHNL